VAALDVDVAEYKEFAARLKSADRKVANALRKRVRDAGQPLAEGIREDGPEGLPQRGGLVEFLRAAKASVSLTQTRAAIRLTGQRGTRTLVTSDLNAINRGRRRHPVFAVAGRRAGWVNQAVAAGTYDAAIEKHSEVALDQVARALDDVMGEL